MTDMVIKNRSVAKEHLKILRAMAEPVYNISFFYFNNEQETEVSIAKVPFHVWSQTMNPMVIMRGDRIAAVSPRRNILAQYLRIQ